MRESTLMSRASKLIDSVRFVHGAMPRPAKAVSMVHVGNVILVKLANGKFWTNQFHKSGAYVVADRHWVRGLLRALRLIGAVSVSEVNVYLAECKRAEDRSSERIDAEHFVHLEKKYGRGLRRLRKVAKQIGKIKRY